MLTVSEGMWIQHPPSVQKQNPPPARLSNLRPPRKYLPRSRNAVSPLKLCSSVMAAGKGRVNNSSSISLSITDCESWPAACSDGVLFAQSLWQRPACSCGSCPGLHTGMYYWESTAPQTLPAIPTRNQIQPVIPHPVSNLFLPLSLSLSFLSLQISLAL